jgi:hypothetical protein
VYLKATKVNLMSALKPEHNACIDCPASLACLTMDRPFEGGRFEVHGITGCTQLWCRECFKPYVIKSVQHFERQRLEWTIAPRARQSSTDHICKQCIDVQEWDQQVANYQYNIRHRIDMARSKSTKYIVGIDPGSTSNSAVCVMAPDDTSTSYGNNNEMRQYLVSGDIANSIAEQATPIDELKKRLRKTVLKQRLMRKQQKARARENTRVYWGGRKPRES